MPADSLRSHGLTVDASTFVGRQDAIRTVEALLDPDGPWRVLIVHGPGGIGKSALLREVRRRAERAGSTVLVWDGRALPTAIDHLHVVLSPPPDAVRPVIVIDEIELLGASLVAVRNVLLDALPAHARVVLAGRVRPDRSWLGDGMEALTQSIALAPLTETESRDLLERRGVDDPERQESILQWAKGSPLALTVAATTASGTSGVSDPDLGDRLVRLLAGSEIDGIDPAILEVAALTWAVDARLIAAALPGRSTRHAMPELLSLSVVEPAGHRAVLHPLLAQAVKARLRSEQPQNYRILVRRIGAHLKARALQGDGQALLELTNLIEDPLVRLGAGLGASTSFYADGIRPGDIDRARTLSGISGTAWLAELERWVDVVPEYTTTVRRVDGTLEGLAIYVPGSKLPDWAGNDPAVGPILDHMERSGIEPGQTLIGVGTHTPGTPNATELAEIVRVGNASIVARTTVTTLRYLYTPFWEGASVPVGFLTAMGYRQVPGLARTVGDDLVTTWLADFGVGGLIGFIDAIVARENGGGAEPPRHADPAALLAALREFTDDAAMAARAPDGVAETARQVVRDAIDAEFDQGSPADRALRRILELTYLEPDVAEQAILDRLHLSRATYYRRLRVARERLIRS